ncbi:septation regulator SpoVG [Ruminococcus sp. XPD3002]|uniref:septation regulator SpoVG n=1 Tax=Ruminococcus sp. XPD3002 TaxID=1452269 RepID=UPI00090FAB11|nr:stage V sporulation protein G [Ruminococcus flavefaciens]
MEITDVKIRKIMSEGRLRAVVSVTVDDMLAVHDIKVVQGDERLFVAMPSRKDENGVFRDIVHPISPLARKQFEEVILEAYQRQLVMIEAEEKAAQAETLTAQAEQESSDALTDIYKMLADADPGQSAE